MDFTQQHLDTINELAASYFRNGEAKTIEDVNRVLDLVTVSRTQKTTAVEPNKTLLEQIRREQDSLKNSKEWPWVPTVPWPEPPYPIHPIATYADSANLDFPRTA